MARGAVEPTTAARSIRSGDRPRVLVTGGAGGIGRACAVALARRPVELILCDNDSMALAAACKELGAHGRFCDVASEASVAIFSANFLRSFAAVDMIVNAAGTGHERMIGMHRISRALLPALRQGQNHNLLINVPPGADQTCVPFRYANSRQAFLNLSVALAMAARGSAVEVYVACPQDRSITRVAHDFEPGEEFPVQDFDDRAMERIADDIAALVADGGRRQAHPPG